MAPGQADLASPAIGGYLYRYLVGKDDRAPGGKYAPATEAGKERAHGG